MDNYKLIAQNKKAFHDYHIEEKFEAGLVLAGTEVKSLRMGKASIKESFIRVSHGEVFIHNMNIASYEKGADFMRRCKDEGCKVILQLPKIWRMWIGLGKVLMKYFLFPAKIMNGI